MGILTRAGIAALCLACTAGTLVTTQRTPSPAPGPPAGATGSVRPDAAATVPSAPAAAGNQPDTTAIRQSLARRDAAIAALHAGGSPGGTEVRLSAAAPPPATSFATGQAAANAAESQLPAAGIFTVNEAAGGVIKPGSHVIIGGRGFDQLGAGLQVRMLVNGITDGSPRDAVALESVSVTPNEVDATLPSNFRDHPDDSDAAIEVAGNAVTYHKDGVRFVADRESVDYPVFRAGPESHLWRVFLSTDWKPAGESPYRFAEGENIDCPANGGSDTIRFVLKPGFVVTGAEMLGQRTDTGDGDGYGNPGSRVVFGKYDLFFEGDDVLHANWAVWRSHRSPITVVPGVDVSRAHDICFSSYMLSITIEGPAGVPAW